jgi:hypothetical protein
VLSKCANPGCPAPFRYLHEGKLFRMEVESAGNGRPDFGADTELKKPGRRVEFFWLCEKCAAQVTLNFEKGGGVITKPLAAQRAAS